VLSGLTAELCFDATDFRVSFIGHSHVALSFHRPEGFPAAGSTQREGTALDLTQGEWLINPGSTGQPRDGDPRAAWLLLDTEAQACTYMRSEYDIAGAQAAIRAARLPDSLAERLQYGQ
jgi:diadenosine tetraphosphatase ApaH/serine/threonine PP2A family protein phosphatase